MQLDLTKTIQVLCDGKWVRGTPTDIYVKLELGDAFMPDRAIMSVMFATQVRGVHVFDVFGLGSDNWRYKQKCCEQCAFASREGGDIVPYGATTCTTPEGWVCEHEAMEDSDNPYDDTQGGKECKYHQFIEE